MLSKLCLKRETLRKKMVVLKEKVLSFKIYPIKNPPKLFRIMQMSKAALKRKGTTETRCLVRN